ncbi:hypothetical protein KFZ70_16275 [Tamlana fucoidanivorans]|uniref:Sigma-70 family RNA polymerase sigma factor n=1 Tax=Allotamlana fucoidanivorans TaxID=2583814 RepID=A0A5C4SH40_9FLAO|nr:hypothetical protein [Tamlana fucoidanivorans]TNJ42901.1 hypothetical protein FGF67_13000 [Tamlana fucoidanivorans]
MCTIEKLNDRATQTTFNKKVVSNTQHLQAYVKHRLYISERTKTIPKNMYNSHDFIDEAVAKFYEQGYDIDMDNQSIKMKLFKIVNIDLDDLFKKEAFHKNTLSTHIILEEELDSLEEKFTIDEGLDLIMNDELDDISYHQDDKNWQLFLYSDRDNSPGNHVDIDQPTLRKQNNLLGRFYSWLPLKVSDIVDLLVFGKLNFNDIAEIKNIEPKRVERVLNLVFKSFRTHLD